MTKKIHKPFFSVRICGLDFFTYYFVDKLYFKKIIHFNNEIILWINNLLYEYQF